MNIFVLHAHPDTGSFTDGLADAYVKGAGGHQVERTNIRDLQFDLALRGGYTGKQPLEPDLIRQQERIQWCQHLVIVTPCWRWSMPALLKGYVGRVLPARLCDALPREVSVCRAVAAGPDGAGDLHAECAAVAGLAGTG